MIISSFKIFVFQQLISSSSLTIAGKVVKEDIPLSLQKDGFYLDSLFSSLLC